MAKEVDQNLAIRAISQSTNAFASELFQTVVNENPGNLIISPISAAVVLALVAYGARGVTENQLRKVLHLPSADSVGTSGYQAVIDNINNAKQNTLVLANKVFTTIKYPVKPSYKELIRTYFRSYTQAVDFVKSDEAANSINTWVKEYTNKRITDIVSPADFNERTALVLVNAVYFKGRWKDIFNVRATEDHPFHINENTVINVCTMMRMGIYIHGELTNLNAKFVEMPYQGDELSMVIIVPNEINGLPMVEKKLQGMSIADILKQGYKSEIYLKLPKFKVENEIDLQSVLEKMGLTDMFTKGANFSGIAEELYVTKVVQKAFIEVNEKGTEAVAYGRLFLGGGIPPKSFEINRPFWYAIIARKADIILFSGRIINPTSVA